MTVTLMRSGGLSAGRLAAAALPLLLLVGCVGNPREEFGKTYYLDGAGNWGWGVAEVPQGLRSAGYQGDVEIFVWTSSLNPAIDQVNVLGNRPKQVGRDVPAGIHSGPDTTRLARAQQLEQELRLRERLAA